MLREGYWRIVYWINGREEMDDCYSEGIGGTRVTLIYSVKRLDVGSACQQTTNAPIMGDVLWK